jgi:tRNA-(ms[2]io[6]A)-hydroxylase
VLASKTDPRWVEVALAAIDRVLVDHAHCEKKAAGQALALVAAYPERSRLVERLSALAIEELRHFRAVHARLLARGLSLGRDPGDPYAQRLQRLARTVGDARLVDRLLVSGLIEARSCERLELLGARLEDPDLAAFYARLARAEAGHARAFARLAASVAGPDATRERLTELAAREAEILASLPLEPRIH